MIRSEPHTFVFTDIVGFTALTAARGDEAAVGVALEFFGCVRPLLPEHRTHEVKTLGDAMMLRGDDPALAIALGRRIIESVCERPGAPAVRVGMHTGPAVEQDGDWYGTAVNVAARLCHVAGSHEVLVSEATTTAAGRFRGLGLDGPRPYRLKNVSAPVSAHMARLVAPTELTVRAAGGGGW